MSTSTLEIPTRIAGTPTNPLPQPYTAIDKLGAWRYSLTARLLEGDAGTMVADWHPSNAPAPAGHVYVVVEMTMTGIDADGVEPALATFGFALSTGAGTRYDSEYIINNECMPSMLAGPTLCPGESFTGYEAYIVPESATRFLLRENGNYISL